MATGRGSVRKGGRRRAAASCCSCWAPRRQLGGRASSRLPRAADLPAGGGVVRRVPVPLISRGGQRRPQGGQRGAAGAATSLAAAATYLRGGGGYSAAGAADTASGGGTPAHPLPPCPPRWPLPPLCAGPHLDQPPLPAQLGVPLPHPLPLHAGPKLPAALVRILVELAVEPGVEEGVADDLRQAGRSSTPSARARAPGRLAAAGSPPPEEMPGRGPPALTSTISCASMEAVPSASGLPLMEAGSPWPW
jgi:hypothetical protein